MLVTVLGGVAVLLRFFLLPCAEALFFSPRYLLYLSSSYSSSVLPLCFSSCLTGFLLKISFSFYSENSPPPSACPFVFYNKNPSPPVSNLPSFLFVVFFVLSPLPFLSIFFSPFRFLCFPLLFCLVFFLFVSCSFPLFFFRSSSDLSLSKNPSVSLSVSFSFLFQKIVDHSLPVSSLFSLFPLFLPFGTVFIGAGGSGVDPALSHRCPCMRRICLLLCHNAGRGGQWRRRLRGMTSLSSHNEAGGISFLL